MANSSIVDFHKAYASITVLYTVYTIVLHFSWKILTKFCDSLGTFCICCPDGIFYKPESTKLYASPSF